MEKYGEEIILVQFETSDCYYQLIRSQGQILAYRVGGAVRGVVKTLVQEPQKPLRPLGKKDRAFPIDETLRAVFTEKVREKTEETILGVRIYSAKRSYSMRSATGKKDDDDILQKWIEAMIPHCENRIIEPEADQARVFFLRYVNTALTVAAVVIDILWMFFDVPYRLFATLAALPFLAILALYCIFPNEVTFSHGKKARRKQASFEISLGIAGLFPMIQAFRDYNIQNWWRLFAVATIVLIILSTAALCFNKEWRYRKHVLFLLFLTVTVYAVSVTAELNYALDYSEAEQQPAIVEDMEHSIGGRRRRSHYRLTVRLPSGEVMELETDSEFYRKTGIGDEVKVETYSGAFGIPYAIVKQSLHP